MSLKPSPKRNPVAGALTIVMAFSLLSVGILHSDLPERVMQCAGRLAKSALTFVERESYAQSRDLPRLDDAEWVRGER